MSEDDGLLSAEYVYRCNKKISDEENLPFFQRSTLSIIVFYAVNWRNVKINFLLALNVADSGEIPVDVNAT